MRLLDKFLGVKSKASSPTLARMLDGYPVYEKPHPGNTLTLFPRQAEDNLSYLLKTKKERQEALSRRLHVEGYDVAPIRDRNEDPLPMLRQIGEWFRNACLHDYPPERNDLRMNPRDMDDFRDDGRPYDGRRLVLSFAHDLGVLIGDAIIAREPKAYWGLWLDPTDRVMDYYKSVGILGLSREFDGAPVSYEVFPLTFPASCSLAGRAGSILGKQWDVLLSERAYLPPPPPLPDDMLPVHWPDEDLWAERTARDPSLTIDETSGLFTFDEDGNQIEPEES